MKLHDLYTCAVPEPLVGPIERVNKRTGEIPVSVYRGHGAASILNKYGKHTQDQLFNASAAQRAAWGVLGTPDRPGTSTHECKSDGVAFRGPVGRPIRDFQCGMDWNNTAIPKVMSAFIADGEHPIHPYASGLEYHHINLIKPPRILYSFLPLRFGHSNRRVFVYILTARLKKCGYMNNKINRFDKAVESAVKLFQRDHHLNATGVVDIHTWLNLRAAVRKAKKKK